MNSPSSRTTETPSPGVSIDLALTTIDVRRLPVMSETARKLWSIMGIACALAAILKAGGDASWFQVVGLTTIAVIAGVIVGYTRYIASRKTKQRRHQHDSESQGP